MADEDAGAWVADVTEEVLLTHKPTGVVAKGTSRDEALGKLTMVLVGRGDISINDARAAHGLKPFNLASPGESGG